MPKNRKMKTVFITGNNGVRYEVCIGLQVGQELICIKTKRSTSGIGLWSTELYDAFEKDKTYKVEHLFNWDGIIVAYVLDEDSTYHWVTPETFKLKI